MDRLDDFGAGHNSRAYLISLMPEYVKLDIELIHNIDTDKNRLDFLENLIIYFKSKNIKIIAEGVETKEELEVLALCGVDYIQGFFFGRPQMVPVPPLPEAVEHWLTSGVPTRLENSGMTAADKEEVYMFRLMGTLYKNSKILKDTVLCDETGNRRTQKVFNSLEAICYSFDLEKPIWLESNLSDFKQHSKTRFYQDNFIEDVDFDYLEIRVIEED